SGPVCRGYGRHPVYRRPARQGDRETTEAELMPPTGHPDTQDSAAGRHAAVIHYLRKTAAEISSHSLSHIRIRPDWEQHRPAMHRQLLFMLGLEPLPHRTPLQA